MNYQREARCVVEGQATVFNYFFTWSKTSRSTSWLWLLSPFQSCLCTAQIPGVSPSEPGEGRCTGLMSPAQRPHGISRTELPKPRDSPEPAGSSWTCRAGRMQRAALSSPQPDKKELKKQIIWFLHGALFSVCCCIWRPRKGRRKFSGIWLIPLTRCFQLCYTGSKPRKKIPACGVQQGHGCSSAQQQLPVWGCKPLLWLSHRQTGFVLLTLVGCSGWLQQCRSAYIMYITYLHTFLCVYCYSSPKWPALL